MGVGLKRTGCFLLAVYFSLVFTSGQQRFSNFPRQQFFDDDAFMHEDIHFFGAPSDPFWEQFFDVYNYRGPLQEDTFRPVVRPTARPYKPTYDVTPYYRPDYFVPKRDPYRDTYRTVRGGTTRNREDEYNRYRDYFYRRYGTNYGD